jgi:hypothetical protein
MPKRSVLTLATILSLIGISDAFGQCAFVKYYKFEHRRLEVRPLPVLNAPATVVEGVLKVRLLSWPYPTPNWRHVETIRTTTGGGAPTTGWVPANRVGAPTNCFSAYR